jgi:pimeloyl-ACP methyl ester carboxylesterase
MRAHIARLALLVFLPVIASRASVSLAAPCASWTNPAVTDDMRDSPDADTHPDLAFVPEGLTVVGPRIDAQGETLPLDCAKPTVIFIHGWSPFGEATYFPEAQAWRSRFNVLVFRWHRLAYARRVVFPAEGRVPEALERLEREVEDLYWRMGGNAYKQEIRVVGHSLGSQLALPLMRGVLAQGLVAPRRLELLDPFVWTDLRGVDVHDDTRRLVPSEHYDSLRMVRALGVHTAVYASSVQRNMGLRMPEVANVQAMSKGWLKGNGPTCHIEMATWYFQSLSAPPPALVDAAGNRIGQAFSASLPIERFPKARVKYVQVDRDLDAPFAPTQTFAKR